MYEVNLDRMAENYYTGLQDKPFIYDANGCEIYENEDCYEVRGKIYCGDCLREAAFNFVESLSNDELADLLNSEYGEKL